MDSQFSKNPKDKEVEIPGKQEPLEQIISNDQELIRAPRKRRMGQAQSGLSAASHRGELKDESKFKLDTSESSKPPIRRRMGETTSSQLASGDVLRPAKTRMGASNTTSPRPAADIGDIQKSADSNSTQVVPSDEVNFIPLTSEPPRSKNKLVRRKGDIGTSVKPRQLLKAFGVILFLLLLVVVARFLRESVLIQDFIRTYDGHASKPESAPIGIPPWLGWQHFLNMFFLVLIVKTGWQVRTERKPAAYWTANKGSFFSPNSNTPKKVSLNQWVHQSLDVLWVLNGVIFVVLLFGTGQWMRIIPTSWDIFPNMLSVAIQYASLDWPMENGWIHYNALQMVSYFTIIFVASPLAIISGIRFSTWWPEHESLNKIYPVEWARAVHLPVMLFFVAFTCLHVFLVFFTGVLKNLNHMYTSRDITDWWGVGILAVSLVVIAAAWVLIRPMFIVPIATRMGKISK